MAAIPKVEFRDMWQAWVEPLPHSDSGSLAYDRIRSCAGKKNHATMEIAEKVARKQSLSRGREYQAYHCRWCHLFHIGSKVKSNL